MITKGWDQYKAPFLDKSDTSYKQARDVLASKVVMPDPDSITAWMVRATLLDLGADPKKLSLATSRYRDGTPSELTKWLGVEQSIPIRSGGPGSL